MRSIANYNDLIENIKYITWSALITVEIYKL